jgi:5'-nucleotidase/UDP-sugar diphosphatase
MRAEHDDRDLQARSTAKVDVPRRSQRRLLLGALASVISTGCTGAPVRAGEPGPNPELTLLHSSDLHSRVWPSRSRVSAFDAELGLGEEGELAEVGGLTRLATLLERERERAPDAVWLDSGDALEGSEVFHRFGGQLEIDLLGSLGLSAMALGNHELSLAAPELAALAASARFPLLAANLAALDGSPLGGRLVRGTVLRAGPLRLGVVGVANPSSPPHLRAAANPWQLELSSNVESSVQGALDELSSRSDVLVVLSHLGLGEDQRLVSATTGIDVLLGGHQHFVTREPEWTDDCAGRELQALRGCSPRRVPIVHSGAYAEQLSRLVLTLSRAEPGYDVEELSLTHLPAAASVPEHPAMLEALRHVELEPAAALAFVQAPISRHGALGGDSPLGNWATDALLAASGADVVLLNSSGLRADLEAGVLLRPDLELLFPFAERWRVGLSSGRQLREGLERAARRSSQRECTSSLQVAGLRLAIDCGACRAGRADCLRVTQVTALGEQPLGDDEWKLVALPSYLTLASADFEAFAAWDEDTALALPAALAASLHRGPRGAGTACEASVLQASTARCRSLFGTAGCPPTRERARALCEILPSLGGQRDGRIQMLP